MMASRSSKRLRSSSLVDDDINQELRPFPYTAGRQLKYCIEWGFYDTICCSGCSRYAESVKLQINNRDHDEAMAAALERRGSYKSKNYKCTTPWKQTVDSCDISRASMAARQKEFIESIRLMDPVRLELLSTPAPTARRLRYISQDAARGITPDIPVQPDGPDAARQNEDDNNVISSPIKSPPKSSRNIKTWNNYSFKSQGQEFSFDLPSSHTIINDSYFKALKKDRERLKQLQDNTKLERFAKNACSTLKSCLAIALAAVPAFALSAAAYVIPLLVTAFLKHYGLYDKIGSLDNYAKSFPSEAYLRKNVMDHAADNMVWLSHELDNRLVFLSCDKGNKKGIDHFVKYLSWIDCTGKLQVHLLDIDGSLGTTEACAKAIDKSLKKLCLNERKILIKGQTTDSGGGGVLDKLAEELKKIGLCTEKYSVAACAIHNLQLQLSRPTTKLLGAGGVGKRNVMQLLHGIYDIQGYMDWKQVIVMMDYSQVFHDKWRNTDYIPKAGDRGDEIFAMKWNRVRRFREFEEIKPDERWKRCPACILTRWQCVGGAAAYGFKYYLLLVKFTQLCINRYKTDNKINGAASDLQSMLLEVMLYSDTTLLNCFHEGYFKQHMDWMMQSKDLTTVCGFQSHQMAIRYYLMHRDLMSLKNDVTYNNGFFHHFFRSLSLVGESGTPLYTDESQRLKAQEFVDTSITSLDKHFKRWITPELLPAALMAPAPIAACVARVITGAPSPYRAEPSRTNTMSEEEHTMQLIAWDEETGMRCRVHHEHFHLPAFELWLRDRVDDGVVFDNLAMESSQALLQGTNFRLYNATIVKRMWDAHLAMASQTQFVERGVKEAQTVAKTGRREEQRSAHAIIRSFDVHCEDVSKDTSVVDRIGALISNVDGSVERKAKMISRLGEAAYKQSFEEARKHLHKEHFRHERVGRLIDEVTESAESNKVDNVRQRETGILPTAAAAGLISYSTIKKNMGHEPCLKEELSFRGFTAWLHSIDHEDEKKRGKTLTFTELKNALKRLEHDRVEGRSREAEELSKTGFKKLSTAVFSVD